MQNAFDEINRKDSILVSVTSRNQSYNQELNLFKKESAILKESIESQRVELVRREIYIKDLKTRLKNTELNVSELDKKLKQAMYINLILDQLKTSRKTC